ncbi:unnamed protein product [Rotaria sp. Silwood2]|nr:unnamed protein product [Rotaria sp. Silwood2]CAF3389534.1 unnamed protein product [Rotaria sp. Silwood2]CAF4577457.1 unnamed protein product [Rotaria sp. Silwood2]
MGENALKNVVTRCYARDEYYLLKEIILNKLRGHIDQYDVPKEFLCKESFGDLDVLIVYSTSSLNIRNLIEELFHPTEICHNGGLIGNISHKIDLKYVIQGLWMNIHTKEFDSTTTSTKLILSTNVKDIFDFLGYNYEQYIKDFNNENDFFQWIIEEKYFAHLYFDDNQINHAHRQRTSKRPIYIKFSRIFK